MDQFTSSDSYGLFRREVTRRSRYVLSLDAREFLRVVAATCKDRLFPVSTTEIFWRAQRGFCAEEREQDSVVYEESVPYGRKRMKPRAEKATEGRANAKGIPCLYFNLAFLSRTFDGLTGTMSPLNPEQAHKAVWAAIDTAFSEPVTDSDDVADYAPTQILAELFRSEGYDGVAYKSAFGENGFNVALFDLDSAKQLNGFLYKVESIEMKFGDNPSSEYFIKD